MKKLDTSKIFTIIGMVAGVLAIIFGIVMLSKMGLGLLRSTNKEFGADFYTYSYDATAAVVVNTGRLIDVVAMGVGFLLIAFGLADIGFFGHALLSSPTETKVLTVEAPAKVEEPPKTAIEIAEEISKYKKLLDSNMITEEEFNARKAQILGL